MFVQTYKCDRCGLCEDDSSGPIAYYQLGDGREVPCMTESVWCYQCDHVRNAEVLVDVDRIEAYIDHIRQLGITPEMRESVEILEKSAEEQFEERIDQLFARLEWRRARMSPPKCLTCGSSDFLKLISNMDEPLESFVHPKCGGTFQYVTSTHYSPQSVDIMDPEGRQVGSRDW